MSDRPLDRLLASIQRIGAIPGVNEEEALRRRYLVYMGLLMSVGGVLWGVISTALGLHTASLIPFGYVGITAVNCTLFARDSNFERTRFIQVLASLLLPFFFQWALGGFAASGAMMIWALVALFGSLIFSEARTGMVWLGLFALLTVVSALLDPLFSQLPGAPLLRAHPVPVLAFNLITVCGVAFGLSIALMASRLRATSRLEVALHEIHDLNEQLADTVRKREQDLHEVQTLEASLRQRGQELSDSLERLQATQRELVQREKMASLGSLVAGVAHEVNTPLGVAVTATSLVQEAVDAIQRQVDQNQLKRSVLIERLGEAKEALRMLETNIQRGAELIRQFKTVAVDQSGGAIRSFEVGAYVREVLASLAPILHSRPIEVTVEQSGPVHVTTRAGSLAQVVTNFVTNALTHAFEPTQPGTLVLEVGQSQEQATLVVRDDGRGMPPEVAARAFDPFYTTRGGAGGSGLGLFIVHNLVHEGLGGSVLLESELGRGTTFRVKFPLRIRA
jgi:signal transduction histidine kinase